MPDSVIENVTLVPGGGAEVVQDATVVLDGDGVVAEIVVGTAGAGGTFLVPSAVDLHLDNLTERRRPRATVTLDQEAVLSVLDAECAAAGIGVVCLAARCEDAPGKGVHIEDATALAAVVERLAPSLACDWRLHARVEVTDDSAVEALRDILEISSRVALVSVMEHSVERSRFASPAEHRTFYAADWGVPLAEVDRILAVKSAGGTDREDRRREVAAMARTAGVVLASHDDRSPGDVEAAHALGASIAEFPLTMAAAHRARELGMATVLGAPNALRGRSTSPGNLLVTDAVAGGACDVLCSDYLPLSLQAAPHALVRAGAATLGAAVDLVSTAPALAIGLPSPAIEVGRPLTASLGRVSGATYHGLSLWREGQLTFSRAAAGSLRPVLLGTGA